MSQELEAALAELERAAARAGRPGPHLARAVLLALGGALRTGASYGSAWVERARSAGRAAGKAWDEAVRTELSLACGEFAQCLDPRYLDLPGYDLDYTRSARERLEARLVAARALGFELSPRETDMLALADRVLSTVGERRRQTVEAPSARPKATGRDGQSAPGMPERSSRKPDRK